MFRFLKTTGLTGTGLTLTMEALHQYLTFSWAVSYQMKSLLLCQFQEFH